MSEKVIIRQKRNYETDFMALDPDGPGADKPRPVQGIHELTPYGMVLAGLGTCTAFVVNTYAEHHNVNVDVVELKLEYQRIFKDDCVNCEAIDKYEEQISMTVGFEGDLTAQERDKLFKISMHCPVHKMLKSGITVKATPA
jgi:putative redox protein